MPALAEQIPYSELPQPVMTTALPWIPIAQEGSAVTFAKKYRDSDGRELLARDTVDFGFLGDR